MAWTVPQTYGKQVSQVHGVSSDIINVMEERHGGITSHRNYRIALQICATVVGQTLCPPPNFGLPGISMTSISQLPSSPLFRTFGTVQTGHQ